MNESVAEKKMSQRGFFRMRQLHNNYILVTSLGIKSGLGISTAVLFFFSSLSRLLNPVGSEDYSCDTALAFHQIQGHGAAYQIYKAKDGLNGSSKGHLESQVAPA